MPVLSSARSIKEVYVTAAGGITPAGGFSSLALSPDQPFLALTEGAVTEDLILHIGAKGFRFHDRSSKLILVASKKCLEASALLQRYHHDDINVIVGSDGALQSQMDVVLEAVQSPQIMNPKSYPNRGCNVIAGQVSLMFGLRGESTVLSAGYRSGTDALIYAVRKIENGAAPYLVAAGEALSVAREVRSAAAGSSSGTLIAEGSVSFTLERTPWSTAAEGFPWRIVGYRQVAYPENPSWNDLAEDFLKPFDVAFSEVDFIIHGQDGNLEIGQETGTLKNPFDLFGGTALLGLAGVLLARKRKRRYVLLIDGNQHGHYSMVLLTST